MPAILYLFALTNLVIGTGAFVLSGILQPVATSLQISVAAAGQVMTAYALTSAFIGPVLIATGKWPRKRALLLALGIFGLGAALTASASSYAVLIAGRVLMGVGSSFTAMAAAVAVSLVAPERRGRALSLTFLGMSLSYAIGVSFGAWLGLRFGWQVPVWLVAGGALSMAVVLTLLLPSHIASPGASFKGMASVGRQWPVIRVWTRTLLYFIAIFSVFSYIGPVLLALNPLTPAQLSGLVMFGLSGVVGTIVGGWSGDRFGPVRTLRAQLSVLALMMVLVPLTQGYPLLTVLVLMVWGVAGFGMMSPQQVLLATHAPQQAPILMSLNGSMLYVGTALGAVFSGAVVAGTGFARLAWVGVPFALLALATLWFETHRPPTARAAPV